MSVWEENFDRKTEGKGAGSRSAWRFDWLCQYNVGLLYKNIDPGSGPGSSVNTTTLSQNNEEWICGSKPHESLEGCYSWSEYDANFFSGTIHKISKFRF